MGLEVAANANADADANTSPHPGPDAVAEAAHAGSSAELQPTTYYFAYGSNLHLKQMKRRCPNSKYIGRARLSNYRWQINERGYANVVDAEGHWVDGLVFEIDDNDETRLDINEGVSKNAYAKRYMSVLLFRAHGVLYRRPTSWIVNKGGPAKVCREAKLALNKPSEQRWIQDVLVYISLDYVRDSSPKEEYVNRINLGLIDAAALGMDDDYIVNCIRPFIPDRPAAADNKPSTGIKRSASPRTDITTTSGTDPE
ncbi:Butirosin biosynthesis, BtrG-like protein [Stachybotrys elegans]|uniref:gamma-glutamylcyclotransferase n=1 Tax=Stachybotrys elegans TaxID=80388 RepID=A0A8K0WQ96_9HYPO|nr:Butirosin biosynthesis, BtrG-like protein [Stachybotrys elegans]